MVLYENNQWQVTNSWVETKRPEAPYHFAVTRLAETTERSGRIYYDWPLHLAEKEWVDLEAFIEAFSQAMKLCAGKYSPPLDQEMLEASIQYARKLRRKLANSA